MNDTMIEHNPLLDYDGPPLSVLNVNLEMVDDKLFTNILFGNRENYSGIGFIFSGEWDGLVSMNEFPEGDKDIDFILRSEGLEIYQVDDIRRFF